MLLFEKFIRGYSQQSWMVMFYSLRHFHFSSLVMVHILPVFPFLFSVGAFSWKLFFLPASTRWLCQQLWWVSAGPGPSSLALSFYSLSSSAPVSGTPLLPPTGKTGQYNSYISKCSQTWYKNLNILFSIVKRNPLLLLTVIMQAYAHNSYWPSKV